MNHYALLLGHVPPPPRPAAAPVRTIVRERPARPLDLSRLPIAAPSTAPAVLIPDRIAEVLAREDMAMSASEIASEIDDISYKQITNAIYRMLKDGRLEVLCERKKRGLGRGTERLYRLPEDER